MLTHEDRCHRPRERLPERLDRGRERVGRASRAYPRPSRHPAI